jgi:hypothetical protein
MSAHCSYASARVIMEHTARVYRQCVMNMNEFEKEHLVRQNWDEYQRDSSFVNEIDQIVMELPGPKRLIIVSDYLRHRVPGWHKGFYADSTYYRLKKEAVEEFAHCLRG